MKKVLLIFYSFAPQNNCAAIPNTKLVKYLEKEEVEITLITNSITPDMELDENLLPESVKKLRRYTVQRSELFLSTVAAQRTKITNNGVKLKMKAETRPFRAWCVSLLKKIYFEISGMDWLHSAKRIVRKNLSNEVFDVVYSSYPSRETHSLAEYVKKKGIAKKWIADFRDPMYYAEYDKYHYKRYMRIQHRFERLADCITIVSEGAMEKFQYDDVPENKITYIPNGFDYDDFETSGIMENEGGNVFRIFYAGTLYSGRRDLSILFKVCYELVNEGEVDKSKISFEYAGNEWPIFLGFAEKYGFESNCVNYGYVSRQRIMEIMSEIDCSVVCTHNTKIDKGVVTGKVFELLLVGKPIITVVGGDEPESEIGKIVRQCHAGIVYEQATDTEDYLELKQWLQKKYKEKKENGKISSTLNVQEREKYSYKTIAHQLYELMDNL